MSKKINSTEEAIKVLEDQWDRVNLSFYLSWRERILGNSFDANFGEALEYLTNNCDERATEILQKIANSNYPINERARANIIIFEKGVNCLIERILKEKNANTRLAYFAAFMDYFDQNNDQKYHYFLEQMTNDNDNTIRMFAEDCLEKINKG